MVAGEGGGHWGPQEGLSQHATGGAEGRKPLRGSILSEEHTA